MNYTEFIASKSQIGGMDGFDPISMPDFLFDFQSYLVDWAIRKGKSSICADCGLGKTPMELVWADNVYRKTGQPVLILTPLAVGSQFVHEAEKFGIEAKQSRDGKIDAGIVITNYEKLHLFRPDDFSGVACDEASILKNFDGATKAAIIEFMRTRKFRLLGTATPAPNDYVELGNAAEALGEMGYQDMIGKFFKQETQKDHLGWGRTKYRMRGHAEKDFWRWICSWSRSVRKPSDIGFDDGRFILPPLVNEEHVVISNTKRDGFLFDLPASTLQEQREERRRTLPERCERAASLVADTGKPAVVWCYLNDEADILESLIPGAKQVSGTDPDERKEELFDAFSAGELRVLVTKPVIACFGMNWQHCSHQVFFPSHSWEQYYQAVRRCWRFGQKNPVKVDMVISEGEVGVLANLQRKADAADKMFANMTAMMNDSLKINRGKVFTKAATVPQWMQVA